MNASVSPCQAFLASLGSLVSQQTYVSLIVRHVSSFPVPHSRGLSLLRPRYQSRTSCLGSFSKFGILSVRVSGGGEYCAPFLVLGNTVVTVASSLTLQASSFRASRGSLRCLAWGVEVSVSLSSVAFLHDI